MIRVANIHIIIRSTTYIPVKLSIPHIISFSIYIIAYIFADLYELTAITLSCFFPVINNL